MRGRLNRKGALAVGPLPHVLFSPPGWQTQAATLSFPISEAHRAEDEGAALPAGPPTCDFARTRVFTRLREAPLYGGHFPLGIIEEKMPGQLGMMHV